MSDYLNPDDIRDAPDEEVVSRPTVDGGALLMLAAHLEATRSMIDAALVSIDVILGGSTDTSHPAEVAGLEVTGAEPECSHPVNRRQSLKIVGSGDNRPRWQCRDCGYKHNPEGD